MKVWVKLPDESPTPEKVMIAKGEGTFDSGGEDEDQWFPLGQLQ